MIMKIFVWAASLGLAGILKSQLNHEIGEHFFSAKL